MYYLNSRKTFEMEHAKQGQKKSQEVIDLSWHDKILQFKSYEFNNVQRTS